MLRNIIGREIERGRLGGDLDPSLTVVSILGLALFPFISLPVTTRVLGIDASEAGIEKLITHTVRVLLHGIARGEQRVT
jgi:hypothetical protein